MWSGDETTMQLDLIKCLIDREEYTYLLQLSSSFIAKAGSECSSGLLLGNRSRDIGNALFFHSQTRHSSQRRNETHPQYRRESGRSDVNGKGEVQHCKTATKKQAKIIGLQNSNKEVSKYCIGTDSSPLQCIPVSHLMVTAAVKYAGCTLQSWPARVIYCYKVTIARGAHLTDHGCACNVETCSVNKM